VALAAVQRFEADSKFFRSLVVVLLLMPWLADPDRLQELLIVSVILLPLALWRYMEQRHKATNQAYWSVITLEGRRQKLSLPPREVALDEPTHAGGVVHWSQGEDREYLLVEASKVPGEWVLPKGHIEFAEHPRETAVREVREETGVWASITGNLGRMDYTTNGKSVRVQLFLMERLEQGPANEAGRKHQWLPLEQAVEATPHDKTREMLRLADKLLNAGKPPDQHRRRDQP
jgi:ADP-ribose pyrophosphatase YjhB (NUDIX family)